MKFKKGVSILGIKTEMLVALQVCEYVYEIYDEELVVTSVCDGKHSATSRHYQGMAIDTRTRYFTDQQKLLVAKEITNRLGKDFLVLVETNHLHISFKPRR